MLDIVVPVYNEGDNIGNLLNNVSMQINEQKKVIIVYDFEEDTTVTVVNKIKNTFDFEINLKRNNYGRGALNAIKTGLETADSEAVVVIMADLSDSLEIIDDMYKLIHNAGYDLVCGSRYMQGGEQHGGPFLKGLFSRIAGVTLHFLTRIPTHDISNSFKMYRSSMIRSMTIESAGGFEIGMEITVKAYINGYRITEIPSKWFDREEGKSNFKMWEWIPYYLHWYFLCVLKSWSGKRKRTAKAEKDN